jgi:hypothetical protein
MGTAYSPARSSALILLRAQKGGFFGPASAKGIALLFPDTSPRGAGIEGEDANWDFGIGAGFYLNATHPKFAKHYNMLTHVTLELPQVIAAAGLPIVCLCCVLFGPSTDGLQSRISHASLSLDTACKSRTSSGSLFFTLVAGVGTPRMSTRSADTIF